MAELKELIQTADWKKEKHVPVIDATDSVKKGEIIKVSIKVGKEIPHPNTTAHHIASVAVFFQPDGEKFPYQLARAEFNSHGASTEGADTSSIYTGPEVSIGFKTEKSGTLLAVSYCNIHGLWQGSKKISVV